jgi:hypothetical protein
VGLRRKKIASETTPLWEVELKSKLKKLRKLEKWAFRPRHGRTDFYEYLKAVYNGWDWADPKVSRQVGRRVAKLCQIDSRKNKSPIRVVIDATSKQDYKPKSRWTQALEYAVAMGARGNAFKNFLDKNGSVYGCATKMAALRKKKLTSSASSWPSRS